MGLINQYCLLRSLRIMVNWRLTLSFEDGGFRDNTADTTCGHFSLEHLTPPTLQIVRNIISDVMLDIPYYMTPRFHKKMIDAVIREANRVYHLWCINNPGFAHRGRVHIIGHSLGSVMAMDILSNQPTKVHQDRDIANLIPNELPADHLVFDVYNLFLVGSPAGLFLFLNGSSLVPRQGRKNSATEDPDDGILVHVAGRRGTYGCLAVDNVYNIVHPCDPVALCLNATVDVDYAATLKLASVPSASMPWFSTPSFWHSATSMEKVGDKTLEPVNVAELGPSVQQNAHNYTPEEISERKAFELNDNGQIDYMLSGVGGPLEVQYVTMLTAHMSYWSNRDFVRTLVREIGRRPGREGTILSMRAQRKETVPSCSDKA
ncbi:DDHD domain-containing protein [Pochonia chlamydosporia 170]|uniref:DDHD domain-containing protein n=1 Tax=Pochonia chlamydosporia 170 TaxID=1380566 RepID=A0A179EWH1_METCM|nr:DDHD domain-containing protein [Pochonia chlamydosporia 170]OAQ57370.1 DDHD domain-containing protein [Pochonia chlamydosporia 170]